MLLKKDWIVEGFWGMEKETPLLERGVPEIFLWQDLYSTGR